MSMKEFKNSTKLSALAIFLTSKVVLVFKASSEA